MFSGGGGGGGGICASTYFHGKFQLTFFCIFLFENIFGPRRVCHADRGSIDYMRNPKGKEVVTLHSWSERFVQALYRITVDDREKRWSSNQICKRYRKSNYYIS